MNLKKYKSAITEIRTVREWDEGQDILKQELERLNKVLGGAQIIKVRRYLDDLELVLDNMKAMRFTLILIRDL